MSLEDMKKKTILQLSNTTHLRFKEPTSRVAKFNTQFIADYSNQKAYIPDSDPHSFMEATNGRSIKPRPINKDGKSCVYGPLKNVFLGSSKDDPANF